MDKKYDVLLFLTEKMDELEKLLGNKQNNTLQDVLLKKNDQL